MARIFDHTQILIMQESVEKEEENLFVRGLVFKKIEFEFPSSARALKRGRGLTEYVSAHSASLLVFMTWRGLDHYTMHQ